MRGCRDGARLDVSWEAAERVVTWGRWGIGVCSDRCYDQRW